MKLTIGLPVYNAQQHLRQSLESLLGQTYGDFKLLISDNASTDGTPDICQEYADRDTRIVYQRNTRNIGMSPNFNLVAARCETPFFKWSTADDYWAPQMIERTLPIIEGDPTIAICYPKTMLVHELDHTEEPYEDNLHLMQERPVERFKALVERIGLCNLHLGIARTSMLRQTTMLKPFPGADLNFMAELSLYGKFYEYPERLFFRRFHPDSSSWARSDLEHQKRRFHGDASKGRAMRHWYSHIDYIRSVLRAPLSVGDKLALIRFTVRRAFWARSALLDEIKGKLTG